MTQRFLASTAVFALVLLLASCGSFPGYVADHWPRWAGGLPDDVPPRPGQPGYAEFISHNGEVKDPKAPAAAGPPQSPAVTAQPSPPSARQANPPPAAGQPNAVAPAAAAAAPLMPGNQGVVQQGGLY